METRGIRNNNPGNIRRSTTQWEGQSSAQPDAEFVTFDTPEHGIRAMARVLQTYRDSYGLDTVRGIISRWAPPNENDTESYIKSVAKQLGVAPEAKLTAAKTAPLIAAIITHENGRNPYDGAVIDRGVVMAGGTPGFATPPDRPVVVPGPAPVAVPGPVYPPPAAPVGPDGGRAPVVVAGPPAEAAAVAPVEPEPAGNPSRARLPDLPLPGAPAPAVAPVAAQEGPGAVSPAPFHCPRGSRSGHNDYHACNCRANGGWCDCR